MIDSWRLKLAGRRETAKRFGWGFADQALSSLTNFVLSFLVIRNVDTRATGTFGLVFATYLLVLGVNNSIANSPLVIRYSGVPHDRWRRGVMSATGTSLTLGTVAGAIVAVIAVRYLEGSTQSAYLALAVSLPGLMLQDSWRQSFFALGRGQRSFVNDLVWAVFLVPTAVLLDAADIDSVSWFVLAWGASATIAAAIGILQSRAFPRPSRIISWWKENRDLSAWFLASNAVSTMARQASAYLLVALTTLQVMGELGAVSVLFSPLNMIVMGTSLAAVPEAVRARRHSLRRLRLLILFLSGALVVFAAGWTVVLLLVPSSLGELLLRDNWAAAEPLILLQGLFAIAQATDFGARTGLAALEAAKQGMFARVWLSVLDISLPAAGAVFYGGAEGILYGGIVAQAVGTGVLFWFYYRAERSRSKELITEGDSEVGIRGEGIASDQGLDKA